MMSCIDDVEKSMRVFDFPDSEDDPPSKASSSKHRQLRRSRKKVGNDKSQKENKNVRKTTNAENYTVCPICRHVFPDKIDDEIRAVHISKCKGSDKPVEILSARNDADDSDVCPVCNRKFLPEEKASDKELHTNKCLDSNTNNPELETNDELLARTLQNEESLNVASSSKFEADYCQICFKDMSKFTLLQKTRHSNDCMDKSEKLEGKNKRTNPTRRAKSTKPSSSKTKKKQCPVCKAEQPENKLNAHMKKCANKNKLSTHQLLQIVREDGINAKSKDNSSIKKTITTVVKPDELNIMDKSIIAEHRNLLEAEDEIIQSTPALPKSNIQRDLNLKGSSSSRNESSIEKDTNFEKKPCPMWDLAAYSLETINRLFLLRNLHPGICDMKNIEEEEKEEEVGNNSQLCPKRQEVVQSTPPVTSTDKGVDDNIINIDSNSNDSFTATQFEKLDILMNLNDAPSKSEKQNENLQNDGGFILDKIDGKIDELVHRSRDRITHGYSSLVASPILSDFTVHCRGSEDIPAHKVILATFCEQFSKLIVEDGLSSLDLKEFSSNTITPFMQFIYTGQLPDPSSLSTNDVTELETLTNKFPVDIFSEFCKLLNDRSREPADQQAATNINEIEIDDDFDLNDIVSTFWQNENIVEENFDEDERNENDDAFSADEIAEMREIFQSQKIHVDEVNDDETEEEEDDDCFFVPNINKTLERSRHTSEDEDIRSQLEGNLLGESPRPSRTLPNSVQKEKTSHSPDMFGSSTIITEEPDIHQNLSENVGYKSSLEANPSTSPRAELSVESRAPLHSYNSYSYGSSAYADTQPIEQNTDKEALLSSGQTSKFNILQDSTLKSQEKNCSVILKVKSKKRGSSGELSILNVSNDKPEVIELDDNSQEKMQCKEVAKVGTLLFSQEDFQSILGCYDKTDVVEIDNKDSDSETQDLDSDDEKNRTVIAKEVSGTDLLEANNQSDVLFPGEADKEKTEECNEALSKTPDRIDSSPIPMSIDTPCLTLNERNNSIMELQDQNDSMSNHSLDDVEIPGLNDISVVKTKTQDDDDGVEMDHNKENQKESLSNYDPDFTVTSSKVKTDENIISIEDDTQDILLANTDFPDLNIEDNVESPCVTKHSKIATSTPHVSREGITKRKFLMLQNELNIESPIEKQRTKSAIEASNVVILESPPRSPPPYLSIKRKTSPSSSLIRSPQACSSTKRKISSSSSTENLSSNCESEYMMSSQKRARKRARKTNETPTAPRSLRVKETVAETSESSENDDVSENESNTNLFRSLKSPFARTRRPSKSPIKTGNSNNSPSWLSKCHQKNTPICTQTTSRKSNQKQLTTSSKKSKRGKKKDSKIKNADFKELLSKHKKEVKICSSTDSGSEQNKKCTENGESDNDGDKGTENMQNNLVDEDDCDIENDSDIESQSILKRTNRETIVNIDRPEDEKSIVIEDSQPDQRMIENDEPKARKNGQGSTTKAVETETNDSRTVVENCGDNANIEETAANSKDTVTEDCEGNTSAEETNANGKETVAEDCGDNEYAYDMPYYGDENDMYFMDDGGYNSFVLEMSPGINSQKNGSTNSNNKSSFLKSNDSKSSVRSVGSSSKEVEKNPGKSRNDEAHQNDTNECLIGDLPADSFNISEINEINNKITSIKPPIKTPQGKSCLGKNSFKTPTNPSVESCKNTDENYKSDNFETPPPNPKDKEACKRFQPGYFKHPETNEAITPMPNFAEYPTPDLKAEIKKYAIREIPKNKMVSKLIEVYKYQHQFSHWEEEPPPKQTRKRKAKTDQKKTECDNDVMTSSTATVPSNSNKQKRSKKSTFEPVCVVDGTRTDDVSNPTETSGTDEGVKKRGKSKKEKKPVASEEELLLYIQGNPNLYQKILLYEPIDFNELTEELEKASLSVINKKMLEKFVDNHGICIKKEEQTKTHSNMKGRSRRR